MEVQGQLPTRFTHRAGRLALAVGGEPAGAVNWGVSFCPTGCFSFLTAWRPGSRGSIPKEPGMCACVPFPMT